MLNWNFVPLRINGKPNSFTRNPSCQCHMSALGNWPLFIAIPVPGRQFASILLGQLVLWAVFKRQTEHGHIFTFVWIRCIPYSGEEESTNTRLSVGLSFFLFLRRIRAFRKKISVQFSPVLRACHTWYAQDTRSKYHTLAACKNERRNENDLTTGWFKHTTQNSFRCQRPRRFLRVKTLKFFTRV